ncbi:MAG: type II toxin-antitoxin system prevent-host-death family antitoxin [Frankiaceae bacterium]|nr:type II toxin-antitoxin system prevent-host-death family antitoxin [Frankiaceae bacterium]
MRTLVGLKPASHYGTALLTTRDRTAALRSAAALVEGAYGWREHTPIGPARATRSTSVQERYFCLMEVGLRELRQQASELVRRAEAGESITVTVSGRPAARLVPPDRTAWRRFTEVAELFAGPADADWQRDRELLDAGMHDPWAAG